MDLRWDPFENIADLRERISRMVEDSLRDHLGSSEAADPRSWAPRVDIYETDSSLVFETELPGLAQADIDIELDGDRLTIKGTRKPAEGREYVRMERPYGPFHRSFAIGVPIDRSGVTATYRDGVLAVTLPKARRHQTRRIKVKVE
ncbi:MAG: Hsp20/alpha crystallin family protein [Armatimonadota bacterium]|nr:MAG: Hsp20/alpha crystallin family protein [Armatimonadota bacterium]